MKPMVFFVSVFTVVLACSVVVFAAEPSFRRGDVNVDGEIDITDPIALLGWLFLGNQSGPGCKDAADGDDTGAIDLTDAIYTLSWLFLGGPPPPEPGPSRCGIDPTEDELDCAAFPSCVATTNNLWWDLDWEDNGEPRPIEVVGGTPQLGHPMTFRVRFHAAEETGDVALALKIVRGEENARQLGDGKEGKKGDEVDPEQYGLGEFLLENVQQGENIYEDLELIVPTEIDLTGGGEYALVGELDFQDLIPETVENPQEAPDPEDPNPQAGDNILVMSVETLFSEEFSDRPNLVLESMELWPETLTFNVEEIPRIDPIPPGEDFIGFSGTDQHAGGPRDARLGWMPRASAARLAFLAALRDPRVEDFEEGYADTTIPERFSFTLLGADGEAVTAVQHEGYNHFRVRQVPERGTLEGTYPVSGEYLLSGPCSRGTCATVIDFSEAGPQRAFGFFLTGDAPGVDVRLYLYSGGSVVCETVVPMNPSQGSATFFGVISKNEHVSFDEVRLEREGTSPDDGVYYGLDDLTVASEVLLDPFGTCAPNTDTKLAANVVVSATGRQAITRLKMEVDFNALGLPVDPLQRLRDAGQLPIEMWLEEGSLTAPGISFDPGAVEIEIVDDEGNPTGETVPERVDRKEFHLEACIPNALLQAVVAILDPLPEGGAPLEVAVTARISTDPAEHPEEYSSTQGDALADNVVTDTITLYFFRPTPPRCREWSYDKKFGNPDLVAGQICLGSGVYLDTTGPKAVAEGKFQATLFGYELPNIVDSYATASFRVPEDPSSEASRACFHLRMRHLTFEAPFTLTQHTFYEVRGDAEFTGAGVTPTSEEPDPQGPDFESLTGGTWRLGAGEEDPLELSYNMSWSKCKSTVIVFVPVGVELEIGGTVGVRAAFEATRDVAEKHDLSLFAGPFVDFYGAASVFLGTCTEDLPEFAEELPVGSLPGEALKDCGKLAGATIDLTFLDFQIGPKVWASLEREPRPPDPEVGLAFAMGVDLSGNLKVLEGKFSLWIHYLWPKICWVRVLGRRVFPYPCGLTCRRAGVPLARFPGFSWDLIDLELAKIEDWTNVNCGDDPGPCCPGQDPADPCCIDRPGAPCIPCVGKD